MDSVFSLAENLLRVRFGDLPGEVVEHTKKHVLDILGVALGGSSQAGVRELYELLTEWGGREEATVIAYGARLPTPHAAQINATMAHALDYDDTGDGPTHPSVVIVPTALALSERQGGIDGREFITAVALGVDMMGRLGRAFRAGLKTPTVAGHPGAGWHLTTLYGYFASAGVAGRLLGLDQEGVLNAMGIAYHQAGGNGQCVTEGALTKRLGPGFAVRGGISAALLAQKGVSGAKQSLEGEVGLFPLYHRGEYRPEPLIEGLGKVFTNMNVTMKPYPCCRGTHDYVALALSMQAKYRFVPETITEIAVYHEDTGYFLLHPPEKRAQPENPVDAQFSIPWAVAAVFARGRAGIGEFSHEAIRSRDITALSRRVRVVVEKGVGEGRQIPAKIGIRLRDGSLYLEELPPQRGTGIQHPPFSEYERKFRDCAAHAIRAFSPQQVDEIIAAVKELERLDDMRRLMRLLG